MPTSKQYLVKFSALFTAVVLATAFGLPTAQAATETIQVWTNAGDLNELLLKALSSAYEEAHPDIHVVVNVGPSGVAYIELAKKRLAAGTMDDVLVHDTGSLFQALDPTKNLVDLTLEPWQTKVVSSFYPVVSVGEKKYGAPFGSAMGGGILYNKAVYKRLGLKIPLTWKQFMANNTVISKAGLIPVIQTYGDSWTAQMFILADEFNLQSAFPNFPALYTANQVQIATVPAALVGFQHLEEVHKARFQNKDYATAKVADGLKYLISGKGVHYPILSFVASDLTKQYPKLAQNIGIFAQPGTLAESNGLTVWMPAGLFIPNTTQHLATAKNFVAYATSPEGLAAMDQAVTPSGPYLIKGAKLTGHLSQVTVQMQVYFNKEGKTAPALEFVSPIKGPNLSAISVQVGSGFMTAKQGAVAYDRDVARESKRLGLPRWGVLTH